MPPRVRRCVVQIGQAEVRMIEVNIIMLPDVRLVIVQGTGVDTVEHSNVRQAVQRGQHFVGAVIGAAELGLAEESRRREVDAVTKGAGERE